MFTLKFVIVYRYIFFLSLHLHKSIGKFSRIKGINRIMLVKDFITKELPVLKSFDTAEYALALMEDFKLKHLPLLSDSAYQCLVSEKDLLALPDPSATIGEPVLFAPAISENRHLHEALAMITRYGLSLLPVVSVDGTYLGAITRDRLVDALSELCNAEAAGSVIVLEMMPQDYSLTDIARLVEANNAHVLNLLSHQDKDTGRLLIDDLHLVESEAKRS